LERDVRVYTLCLFKNHIVPTWEDKTNEKGGIFQMRLQIPTSADSSLVLLNKIWEDLVIDIASGSLPFLNRLNGIRIVDKSKSGNE